jgi:Ca2+-binding EF-hand superfamily protein
MNRKIITASAILLAATAAYAMSEMDSNADGSLSMDELQAVYPDMSETTFINADTDGNGLIDETELAEAQASGVLPADEG